MENFKSKIAALLDGAISRRIFPSYATGISLHTRGEAEERWLITGKDSIASAADVARLAMNYDLASLTKPLATVLAMVSMVSAGKVSVEDTLARHLPGVPKDKESVTIRRLLTHSSGLPAHRPYYRQLAALPAGARQAAMQWLILAEELEYLPGSRALYSDLGFILLGQIVEKLAGVGLEQYFQERIVGPLGLAEGIFYHPLENRDREALTFVPTEDCSWRGRVLCGEVSDENCWVLGGVAGHAGLFGTIEAVLALTEGILDIWQGRRVHPYIGREELAFFLEAQSEVVGSTWALGFDRPTPGGSSSGQHLSPRSVGHLGFTGTSFWIDPEKGLVVVLLTNRVHPSRENILIREFRPVFHDRVVELLKESLKL